MTEYITIGDVSMNGSNSSKACIWIIAVKILNGRIKPVDHKNSFTGSI
jgi:hypothetical protein